MAEWFQDFWQGFVGDFLVIPEGGQVAQIIGRTIVAAVLGGILGYEREQKGKAAGLRTHILVALAAAFFVIIPQQAGMSMADLSRIIQGLAAGVGFLGAGAIIKQSDQAQVQGLTTAASLYFTTAIGVAAGMGREVTAIAGTVVALVVLTLLLRAEQRFLGRTTQSIILPDRDASEAQNARGDHTSTPRSQ